MGYYAPAAHSARCDQCGGPLSGRQERYCSGRCRQAAHRARTRPHPAEKSCPLCGQLFEPLNRWQKYCAYDEAGYDCINAQEDIAEAAEDAREARTAARCTHCAGPTGWGGRGRPRRFCSSKCRQADYRKRIAARTAGTHPKGKE